MFESRLAVAVIGGACMLAAGTGAFVATRMNEPVTQTAAAERQASPLPPVQKAEAQAELPAEAPVHRVAAEPAAPRAVTQRPAERPRTVARAAAPRRAPAPAPRPDPPAPVAEPVVSPDVPANQDWSSGRAFERTEPPVAARPAHEELVIESDSVIGLRIEHTVSSESASVEDQVEARVTRDVMVGSRVALPVGSRAIGHVTMVERGGKMKERAQLAVRFHTLVLTDGSSLPIQTETVFREGDSPSRSSSAKIGGGAVGGAVIGAILGGTKGALIGGSAGAAGGTAAVMAGSRKPATLQGGSTLTVRVLSPVTVTVER